MATQLPPVPPPLDPSIQRVTADGRPTGDLVAYEKRMQVFLDAVKKKLETLP